MVYSSVTANQWCLGAFLGQGWVTGSSWRFSVLPHPELRKHVKPTTVRTSSTVPVGTLRRAKTSQVKDPLNEHGESHGLEALRCWIRFGLGFKICSPQGEDIDSNWWNIGSSMPWLWLNLAQVASSSSPGKNLCSSNSLVKYLGNTSKMDMMACIAGCFGLLGAIWVQTKYTRTELTEPMDLM